MNEKEREQSFVEKTKKHLDESVENIDAETRSHLNRIRHEVLESQTERGQWLRNRVGLPAWGLAAACIALLFSFLYFNDPNESRLYAQMADIDLLASTDGLDLYEEMDFYAWLAEEGLDAG